MLCFSLFDFRFPKVGDAENELPKPPPQIDGTERNRFSDSEIGGFREELANFLFWSEDDDVLEGSGEREEGTECSVFMEAVSDVPEDGEKLEVEKECFVFKEIHSDIIHEDNEKTEVHTESSVLKENIHEDVKESSEEYGSVIQEDGEKSGLETEGFVSIETSSDVQQDGKITDEDETEISVCKENSSSAQQDAMNREEEKVTGEPVFEESHYDVHEDSEKLQERETECSVLMQSGSAVNEDIKGIEKEEEEQEEGPVFEDTDTATTTRKCQYLSGKDVISGFIEEPTTMSFSFREFYMGPDVSSVSNNACASTVIADKVFQELDTEDTVALEGKGKFVQFESEVFGGTESVSSDEDHFLFNENSLESDSDSESSSSSGLIWGNSNKIDDSIAYQFLPSKEGFETEILKLMMKDERTEVLEEKQFSCGRKVSAEDGYIEIEADVKDLKFLNVHGFGVKDQKEGSQHEEEALKNRWEEELCESESDEEDLEWEHDDLVEQLKMELKNARQGGLSTILEEEVEEEEEEEDPEAESPKMVEDLKPLKIEEKLEYKDQIDEIENVYKSYAEKMRKLDILNYQTMHALGENQINFIAMSNSCIRNIVVSKIFSILLKDQNMKCYFSHFQNCRLMFFAGLISLSFFHI